MKLRERFVLGIAIALALGATPGFAAGDEDSIDTSKLEDGIYALFDTTRGQILCKLNYLLTPLTVINFVGLAEGTKPSNKPAGTRFYDGMTFHRVIPNFMIQGGCPLGTGTGGPGYRFPDEIIPTLRHSGAGTLSMANSGPGTNGSQFFITHLATPWLDGKHTVFGRVIHGQNVVNAIRKDDVLSSVKIIRRGKDAGAFKADEKAFVKALEPVKDPKQMAARRAMAKIFDGKKITITKSGMNYTVLKEGEGESPPPGALVTAHYTGWLLNGTKFDSSYDRGVPFKFPVGRGRVIAGWDEALLDMKTGEKRKLGLPPHLAYGPRAMGSAIPPNSTLIFDVELLEFQVGDGPASAPGRPAGSSKRK